MKNIKRTILFLLTVFVSIIGVLNMNWKFCAAATDSTEGELSVTRSKYEQELTSGTFYLEGITVTGDGVVKYDVQEGTDVISVSANGKVTPKKLGEAWVRVYVEDTENYTYNSIEYTIYIRIVSSQVIPENMEHKVFSGRDYTFVLDSPKWVSIKMRDSAEKDLITYGFNLYAENDTERENALIGNDADGSQEEYDEETEIREWKPTYLSAGTYIVSIEHMFQSHQDPGDSSIWIYTSDEVDLSKTTMVLDELWQSKVCTYNGEEFKPIPVLKYGNSVLQENVHYTLSYENNINAGKGMVVANAVMGASTGTKKISFDIKKSAGVFNVEKVKYSRTFVQGAFKLKGIVLQGDGTVTYSVQKGTNVISVDENGMVSVKGLGNAVVKVGVKEGTNSFYSESDKDGYYINVNIKLGKGGVKKIRKISKKTLRIMPQYVSGCAGYQCKVSKFSNMSGWVTYQKKGAKSSWGYLKLKGDVKKCYIMVRAYGYDNTGKKIFGSWSKKKCIKM